MFYNAKIGDVHTGVDSKTMTRTLLRSGRRRLRAALRCDRHGRGHRLRSEHHLLHDRRRGLRLDARRRWFDEDLGFMPAATRIMPTIGGTPIGLADAINNLLNDPQVPFAFEDDFGNQWVSFRFELESLNASTGSSLVVRDPTSCTTGSAPSTSPTASTAN